MVNTVEAYDVMSQAAFHLSLVKKRVQSVNRVVSFLSKEPLGFDYLLELEHAFLDVRKIIEELMLLSVCSHDFAKVELSKALRKEWNAEKLTKYLSRLNPRFFPHPIDIVECDEDGVAGRFIDTGRVCLSREDAVLIYNLCGGILHASNRPLQAETVHERYRALADFDVRVRGLVQTFEIDISGQGMVIIGQLLFDQPHQPPELFTAPYAESVSLQG